MRAAAPPSSRTRRRALLCRSLPSTRSQDSSQDSSPARGDDTLSELRRRARCRGNRALNKLRGTNGPLRTVRVLLDPQSNGPAHRVLLDPQLLERKVDADRALVVRREDVVHVPFASSSSHVTSHVATHGFRVHATAAATTTVRNPRCRHRDHSKSTPPPPPPRPFEVLATTAPRPPPDDTAGGARRQSVGGGRCVSTQQSRRRVRQGERVQTDDTRVQTTRACKTRRQRSTARVSAAAPRGGGGSARLRWDSARVCARGERRVPSRPRWSTRTTETRERARGRTRASEAPPLPRREGTPPLFDVGRSLRPSSLP